MKKISQISTSKSFAAKTPNTKSAPSKIVSIGNSFAAKTPNVKGSKSGKKS